MSSAMSASSPPTGLMPLSLISEHKSAVPGVPLQRTPEKVNPQQQPVGPNAALPPQAGPPQPRVANGMEATPQAAPYPHPQEPTHPTSTMEAPVVATPTHVLHSNVPSGAKSETPSFPHDHRAPVEVKSTPSANEAPVPDIRLPTAPGLTITPIGGIPVSQPVPATPPSLPIPAAQSVPVPMQPVAQPVAAVPAPQIPAPVSLPVIPSVPPPPKEAPVVAPPALAPHNVGGSNLPTPPRPTEPKPVVQPERVAEKSSTVPPVSIDKPALQAVTPPSIPHGSPVKEAAQVPPPAPKPTPPPASLPNVPTGPTQSPSQPESKPAPLPASLPPSKPADVPAAQPATAAAAGPSATVPQQPVTSPSAAEPAPTPQTTKPKRTPKPKLPPDSEKKTPAKETPSDKDDEGKPRRKRLPTQPYQSPIPELNLIAKISKVEKTPAKPQEERLIVFYRNEFLAVRNAEGGYYVCQAMQNIYKGSSRIKIRWLSQDPNGDNYSPDFYDHTEFDCILTNLNLQRVGKDQFKLPEVEAKRTDSILKRAIDVEKGIVKPDESNITEEHPDGLDLSLYRNEEQLKKRKSSKKSPRAAKSSSRVAKPAKPTPEPTKKLPARGGAAAKRKSAPSPPVTSSKRSAPATKKVDTAATPSKKEASKKEVATPAAKSAAKRKAPASAPPVEKKSRRDPASKTKSATAAASVSTPKPSSTSTSRRPTRNSK